MRDAYARLEVKVLERDQVACAKHSGGHRKYGAHLEAYRRFAFALAAGR